MKRYRLVRIGLGAYGDGGPKNPALKGLKVSQHYIDNDGWVSGINFEGSYANTQAAR